MKRNVQNTIFEPNSLVGDQILHYINCCDKKHYYEIDPLPRPPKV